MSKGNYIHMLITSSAVTTVSILAVLFVGTACQTQKGAKGSKPVGTNVKMAELRNVIQTQVPDPSRSAALLGIVSHAERELGLANKNFLRMAKEIGKASANHSKSAGDLDAILRERDKESSARRLRLTNMLLTTKTHTTPQEWPVVSNAFFNSLLRQSDRYEAMRSLGS